MKKIKQLWFLSLGAMFVVFLAIPLTGLAQETTAEATAIKDITQNQHSKAVIVADVNIYNAKLDSQNKHQLTISFQLSNGKKVQPDVQYAVFLTKKDEKGNQITVGKKIYPEVVNLGENQKIDKIIKYTAPAYLDGEYTLWMQSANSVGMIYSVAHIGTVKFQKEKEYIEIQPNSCFLTIGKEEKKYSLSQGVDVKPEENITIHCTLNNHFNQDKTVTPKLVTHLRSSYGKILATKELSQKVSIKANQTQDVSFLIPKVTDPQAYDVTLTFLENKQLVSNSIRLHYVIVGESATIQNIRLDKPTYQKGETAKLSFFWSGRADQFSDARYAKNPQPLKAPQVTVAISDQNGNSCSSLFTQKLNPEIKKVGDLNLTLNIPISKECLGARAEVKILDFQGKVLTQKKVQSPQQKVQKTNKAIPQKTKNTTKNILLLIIFLGLGLVIIAIVIKYINNKKGKNPPSSSAGMKALFFLAILLGGMFLMGNGVEATTFSVDGVGEDSVATYSVSLNKSTYAPGETATMSGSTSKFAVCNNDGDGDKEAYAIGNVGDSGWKSLFHYSYNYTSSGSISGKVSNTPGSYNAQAIGYAYNGYSKSVSLPYTVVAPAANCNLPWGGTISSGSSVTAYKDTSVPCGSSCQSQTRYCTNGSLSGSYTNKSCSVDACPTPVTPSCNLNFSPSTIIAPGSSTATWSSSNATSAKYSCTGPITGSGGWGSIGLNDSVPFDFTSSQTDIETCTITVKNSAGKEAKCSDSVTVNSNPGPSPGPSPGPKSCKLPWGETISSGSKTKAYKNASVPCGSTCQSQTRTCNDGTLSGSYTNKSCSVDTCPTPTPYSLSCNAWWDTSSLKTQSCPSKTWIDFNTFSSTGNFLVNLEVRVKCTGVSSYDTGWKNGQYFYPISWWFCGSGTETCTFYVRDPFSGDKKQCSDTLSFFAPAPTPINGSCGTASKAYPASATSFGNDTFCSSGVSVPPNPVFPSQGSSVVWTCISTNGGDSSTCTATHISACVPNSCAANTCIGQTCDDGCGNLLDGTKNCYNPWKEVAP